MKTLFAAAALGVALLSTTVGLPAAARPSAPATDVLVVGGTPAGVAAAVAAARRGERVELIARRPQLGGILTDAMMDQWDLNLARDGEPIQGGIFAEIYTRLGDSFTPAAAARTFAALVAAEPNIHVETEAAPVAVRTSVSNAVQQEVTSVTFRDQRRGRTFTRSAPYVIDATDNGDVAALAGARYDVGRQDTGRDERMQPVTLLFTVTGVDWPKLAESYDVVRDGAGGITDRRAWGYAALLRDYRPADSRVIVNDLNFGHENGGSVTVNAIDVLGIDGRSDADLRLARRLTETEAPRLVGWLREHLAGFEHARVGRYADAVYVRETRHFAGLERLTASAVWNGAIPPDTIGLSSYPLDLHPLTAGDKPAFAPIRHVYGIPFGSLVPRGFVNLLLASPAISASHLAAGSARVIPTTVEEGEAAGAATALAATEHVNFPAIVGDHEAISDIRDDLVHHGVILRSGLVTALAAGGTGG